MPISALINNSLRRLHSTDSSPSWTRPIELRIRTLCRLPSQADRRRNLRGGDDRGGLSVSGTGPGAPSTARPQCTQFMSAISALEPPLGLLVVPVAILPIPNRLLIERPNAHRKGSSMPDPTNPAAPPQKSDRHRFETKLVNPANKRKYHIIVVGTGLAGASAAASLAELGYNVKAFCIQDSPRRAHSIAAQGGINAAKNYPNDGDSIWRLFYDTVKGGDYRAREANVYRLAQVSNTSSTSAWPRACPLPASTAASWPTAPSAAPRCRAPSTPGPDRPAAAAGRLQRADAPGGRRQGETVPPARNARPGGRRRPGARHHRPQPGHRRARAPRGTPWCCAPAVTATSISCRPTPRPATSRRPGAPTSAEPTSPTPASPRSIRPAFRCTAPTSPS